MIGVPFHRTDYWKGAWEVPGSWVNRASCARTAFPDAWFPEQGDLSHAVAAAKRICLRCPVRRECLNYAMRNETGGLRYGIFGGLTPAQRGMLAKGARRG